MTTAALDPNDPSRTVRLDDIRMLGALSPFFREDANGLWFQKELEHQIARNYERKYPELQMAEGMLIPIRSTIPRGKKTGSYKMYDYTGVAKWLTTGSWKDIPKASASGSRATFEVHEYSAGYGWELGELEEAAATNTPLMAIEAAAATRAMKLFLDEKGLFGDESKGLRGITTVPNMTIVDAPAGAGGAYRWSTTGGTAKTALEMAADINLLIRTMRAVTNFVHRPNQVWVPPSFWEATTRVVLPNTSKTARQFIEETYPGIRFREVNRLESAGTYGGPVIMAIELNDPEELWLEQPIPPEQHGPWQDGFYFGVGMRASTGGVICPYPQKVLRMDFPADS